MPLSDQTLVFQFIRQNFHVYNLCSFQRILNMQAWYVVNSSSEKYWERWVGELRYKPSFNEKFSKYSFVCHAVQEDFTVPRHFIGFHQYVWLILRSVCHLWNNEWLNSSRNRHQRLNDCRNYNSCLHGNVTSWRYDVMTLWHSKIFLKISVNIFFIFVYRKRET